MTSINNQQRADRAGNAIHGASSSRKVYRSSFIPGLHDVCMIFEKAK